MRCALVLLALLCASSFARAATRNNDDSCDIAVMPAATLLLPYFEVDIHSPNGATTLFTITNSTAGEQIVRVTLWTDYSYPVVAFNIYLTGYDVQAVNLYDVLVRGVIGSDNGTGPDVSNKGEFSNASAKLDVASCHNLPGVFPQGIVKQLQDAFTRGIRQVEPACNTIGSNHTNAIGYATIDVVRSCALDLDPAQYLHENLLWDNVLLGDYQQIDRNSNFSEGGTLVHIRAVPEGGTAEQRRSDPTYAVAFKQTFYGQFLPASLKNIDGRQPLPSVFASHWISDWSTFATEFKIWRASITPLNAPCAHYERNWEDAVETVLFDEEENPESAVPSYWMPRFSPALGVMSTGVYDVENRQLFPPPPRWSHAGWSYINLGWQGWVITSMKAEGRFSVDQDAIALGNGCSPAVEASEMNYPTTGAVIGPARNVNP